MSLRQRPPSSNQSRPEDTKTHPSSAITTTNDDGKLPPWPPPNPRQSLPRLALGITANLANFLPTGTLLAFQLLTPIFTNNGSCDLTTRILTGSLLGFLALSCFLASFTDSIEIDKRIYYGFATFKGMYLFDYQGSGSGQGSRVPDLSSYRVRFADWVHAVGSVLMFGVVASTDRNVVSCFEPSPSRETQEVLNIVPVGIGLLCSMLFVAFPSQRNGMGYPITSGKKA